MNPPKVRVLLLLLLSLSPSLRAQESVAYPRISEEGFQARLPFFAIDAAIPLEARVVRVWDEEASVREKFVFRGAQGFLVPGYLEVPKGGAAPVPLVLLLHGWSGSKEMWWDDDNIISGGNLRKALLAEGYAVLALDAATHGERSHEIDFQHVNPHEDSDAPARKNYFSFAEITTQTVKDYRRVLDYVAGRKELDAGRVGLCGYSMGGMDAFLLLSVEPRIKVVVACVPPLHGESYGATAPIDYSWGVGKVPFLLLMGRQDDMYDSARVEASFAQYLNGEKTRLVWYDQGHKLGPVYVPDAVGWLRAHL
jgi:dienelactone hydrolase